MLFNSGSLKALYLHWPFCPYRCSFCPFVALASHDQFMQVYHRALAREIRVFAKQLDGKPRLTSIFFGGGTPSTYPNELLLDMAAILKKSFNTDESEITIEVNPGTVRPGQLISWERMGINRLSIGIQSLNNTVLKRLNRKHSANESLSLIEQAGKNFKNISVDLILGLPGLSANEWKKTVAHIASLPITHISLYFLTVHETTPLYFSLQNRKMSLPEEEEITDLYHWSADYLETQGLSRYELSNFARQGYESQHNMVYWQRAPYKGFGLGACSFNGTTRTANEKNLSRYLDKINSKQSTITFTEELSSEQVAMEKLMLGLRCTHGVKIETVETDLPPHHKQQFRKRITTLKKEHLIAERRGAIALTPAGLVVENEIVTRLLQ